ncbi:MAG: DUF1573 domain-containing protein, partial [Kiritimatiellia bacterium]|nr:DUF1573 domain-containing protein [Kiritimatiellia bacterium]
MIFKHSIRIRRLIWSAGLFLMAFLQAAAGLVCDEPTYDFGDKTENDPVEHEFVIRNEGSRAVEIHAVRPSCGCTVANLSERMIPPGGEAKIRVALSLKGRRGRQRHAVAVESSDRQTPVLNLIMAGRVRADVSLVPSQIFLGRVKSNFEESRSVALRMEGETPVRIL